MAPANDSGYTLLSLAIESGNYALVKALLDQDLRLAEGVTPNAIDQAVKKEWFDILEIYAGASHNLPAARQDLPRIIINAGSLATWKRMRPFFDYEDLKSSHILHYAVKKCQIQIVGQIVEEMPMLVFQKDQIDHTPLYYNNSPSFPRSDLQKQKIREIIVQTIVQERNTDEYQAILNEAQGITLLS